MDVNVKKRILLTLSSGKFWVFLALFVVAVCKMFEPGADIKAQIYAAVIALGDVVAYMITNVMSKKYKPVDKENE